MKSKGASKPLWIIAIVGTIFLLIIVGGMLALFYGVSETVEKHQRPANVENVQIEVRGEKNKVVLLTSIKAQKEDYTISLEDPDGIEISNRYIWESDMVDKEQTVKLDMTDSLEVTPSGGTYSVKIIDDAQNLVYSDNLYFQGAELVVENLSTAWEDYGLMGYSLKFVSVTLNNSGDLPAYVTGVNVEIGAERGESFVPDAESLISPEQTKTVVASNFIDVSLDEPKALKATFELLEGNLSKRTIKTFSREIEVR